MSTALVSIKRDAEQRFDDPEMVRTLKDTVCKGATDSQFRMFVEICKSTGLNPFLKEIWFVPSVGVMAGRDGYLRVANENPNFDGMETTVERDNTGRPIKATCRVWRKDRTHPTTCEAYFNEYKKSGNIWSQYPSAMISKVAEVLALKRSFSINGVVTEEEIGEEHEPPKTRAEKSKAAKDVAAAKIAVMQNGGTQAEASAAVEHIIDAETEPVPAQTSDVQAIEDADKFKALTAFRELKNEMRAQTGSDDLYYRALGAAGYEKSNQIPREDLRAVYRAVAKAFTQWKAEQPLPEVNS